MTRAETHLRPYFVISKVCLSTKEIYVVASKFCFSFRLEREREESGFVCERFISYYSIWCVAAL